MPSIYPDDNITQAIIDEWNLTSKGRAALVWYDHIRKTMNQPLVNTVTRQQKRFAQRKDQKSFRQMIKGRYSDVVPARDYVAS